LKPSKILLIAKISVSKISVSKISAATVSFLLAREISPIIYSLVLTTTSYYCDFYSCNYNVYGTKMLE